VDLVLELRQGLREAKRFDLADKARDALQESGFDVQDHADGARWSRQ
jgi:cysteinyl-tRNA synthetase